LFAILIQVACGYPFSIMVSLVNSTLPLVSEVFILGWFFGLGFESASGCGEKRLEKVEKG
jgi:hypothetical protein